ncbi:hypothetical protein FDECE_3574 [Fusarium decemcellulare]|nr:hypothetical protein FDECE_3574 [Fusarium decemcellulare]
MDNPENDASSFKVQNQMHGACIACQKRKTKCDGHRPSCQQCQKRDIECQYQKRRFRGPGKRKEYTNKLEERLKRIEDSLKFPETGATQTVGSRVEHAEHTSPSVDSDDPASSSDPSTRGRSMATTQINELQQNPAEPQNNVSENFSVLASSRPNVQLSAFLQLPPLPSPTAKFSPAVMQANVKHDMFKMTQFSPQHSYTNILPMIDDIAEDISQAYPLVTMSYIEELLTPKETDDSVDRVARMSMANSSLALAFQWKAANFAFGELSPLAWAYFKSAVSTCTLLLFSGSSTLSYEAMLMMTMFMQGTADMHIASHINTFAVRACQTYEASHADQVYSERSEQRLRAFWALASLDIDLALRTGIPPGMSDGDIAKDLPSERPLDSVGNLEVPGSDDIVNVVRLRAELTKIQFRVYRQLRCNTAKLSSSSCEELSTRVTHLNQDLEHWQKAIPMAFQPNEEDLSADSSLPLPIILMNLTFHDLRMKVQALVNADSQEECAASARATIRLMKYLPTKQFTALWRILVYPVSAVLVLLAAISNEPVGPGAGPNLSALRELSYFLNDMCRKEDCEMIKLLAWCTRIEGVAAGIAVEHPTAIYKEGQKKLCKLFSRRTDYLRLAQSLMGRMVGYDATLIRQLLDICDMRWIAADEFGPLVPDVLKPKIEEGCATEEDFHNEIQPLTPAQHRLVRANLRRMNRFMQAQPHSLGLKKRRLGFEIPTHEFSSEFKQLTVPLQDQPSEAPNPMATGILSQPSKSLPPLKDNNAPPTI